MNKKEIEFLLENEITFYPETPIKICGDREEQTIGVLKNIDLQQGMIECDIFFNRIIMRFIKDIISDKTYVRNITIKKVINKSNNYIRNLAQEGKLYFKTLTPVLIRNETIGFCKSININVGSARCILSIPAVKFKYKYDRGLNTYNVTDVYMDLGIFDKDNEVRV